MRFFKWLRSLFAAKPVAPAQQPEFKGVDTTPSRRGASSYVLPEADPLRYWQGPMGDVRMPPKKLFDPEASFRNARRPSASQAEHMRAEALAQQEQRHAQRVRETIHKARMEEAEQRERIRRTTLGGNSFGQQEQSSADWSTLAGVAAVNLMTSAGSANSCAAPEPFKSGDGGDFGGAGAGGSWKETAPAPYYGSSSDDCSSSSSSSSDSSSPSCSSSD